MTELEKAKEEFNRARLRCVELEAKDLAERRIPAMKANIGSCWKYRNSFSCPQSDADYWWMYGMIIGITNEGSYQMVQFQTDTKGAISIVGREHMDDLNPGWQRIRNDEFDAAARALVAKVTELLR